jgi:hypothetical protein
MRVAPCKGPADGSPAPRSDPAGCRVQSPKETRDPRSVTRDCSRWLSPAAGRIFDGCCALGGLVAAGWFAHEGAGLLAVGWGLSAILSAWSCQRDGTGKLLRAIAYPEERRAWLLAFGMWVSSWR